MMSPEEEYLKEDRFHHDEYDSYKINFKERLQAKLKSPNRFQSIFEREHHGVHSAENIKSLSSGRYLSTYKGAPILKGPKKRTFSSNFSGTSNQQLL